MEDTEHDSQIERPFAVALKGEPEVWTPDCLDTERILALAERATPEADAVPLLAHVALCARCRREYAETVELLQLSEEVRALEAEVQAQSPSVAAPSRTLSTSGGPPTLTTDRPDSERRSFWQRVFSPGLGFALGAAAAGVALFLGLILPVQTQRDSLASALRERETRLARDEQERNELEQALTTLKGQKAGDAAHLAKEVGRLEAEVTTQGVQIARLEQDSAALQQAPLPVPEWSRTSAAGRVRGGGGGPEEAFAIPLLRPVNTAVRETTPTLEVRPVSGATGYRISLEREDSNEEIAAPKPLSAHRWRVTTPLAEGKVYRWAVTAQRGGEQLRSAVGTFYILSRAQKQEIEAARRQYAQRPLALGAIYARLGLWTEAEARFRAVLQGNPNHPVAKRWLQEIAALRR